jgi:hypothetical protein
MRIITKEDFIMKVVFNEHDKNYADRVNSALEEDDTQLVSYVQQKGKKYYLEFEVTDPGKASAFVMNLMNRVSPDQYELEESLGIKVHAINYSVISKNDINTILQKTMNEITNL